MSFVLLHAWYLTSWLATSTEKEVTREIHKSILDINVFSVFFEVFYKWLICTYWHKQFNYIHYKQGLSNKVALVIKCTSHHEVKVYLHAFLTPISEGNKWSVSCPGCLIPGKRDPTTFHTRDGWTTQPVQIKSKGGKKGGNQIPGWQMSSL